MSCVSRVTWSISDFLCLKPSMLPREQWANDRVDTIVDESLEDFEGDTQQRYGTIALWDPQWLLWLRDRNY